MENWSYKRNGAVEGPVSKDRLKSLYDSGEITRQTLVRSSSSGGAWRRYGDVADLHPFGAQPRIPRAVKHLWPWFVFGTPLVGGLIDVFLIQSTGNEFVESNSSWLSHAPIGVNILAIVVWLFLILIEIQKSDQKNKVARMVVYIVVAPLYQFFSWWTTALVSSLINVPLGAGLQKLPRPWTMYTKFVSLWGCRWSLRMAETWALCPPISNKPFPPTRPRSLAANPARGPSQKTQNP